MAVPIVYVSLNHEGISPEELQRAAHEARKSAIHVQLHEVGGMTRAIEACMAKIPTILAEIEEIRRTPVPVSNLVVGIKCGSSDATSGLVANPAVGWIVDQVVEGGGRVIFGETTEFIGAEHILAERCKDAAVKRDLLRIVSQVEERVKRLGGESRGAQPTPGKMKVGLTTS